MIYNIALTYVFRERCAKLPITYARSGSSARLTDSAAAEAAAAAEYKFEDGPDFHQCLCETEARPSVEKKRRSPVYRTLMVWSSPFWNLSTDPCSHRYLTRHNTTRQDTTGQAYVDTRHEIDSALSCHTTEGGRAFL